MSLVTQSGSPASVSAFSSDGGSPTRKMSIAGVLDGGLTSFSHYTCFMRPGTGQVSTSSRTYTNGSSEGRTANFTFTNFGNSLSDADGPSVDISAMRAIVFQPRFSKVEPQLVTCSDVINCTLKTIQNDISLCDAVSTARWHIIRQTAFGLILFVMFLTINNQLEYLSIKDDASAMNNISFLDIIKLANLFGSLNMSNGTNCIKKENHHA